MRLAVLSDIHGNLPALQATLAAIAADTPDAALWCAGDFVGYGPWPDACVQEVMRRNMAAIAGNYDEKTLAFPRKAKKWRKTKDPRKFRAFEHAYENLSPESRAYLAGLPEEHRATLNSGHRILMIHSAPDSPKYGIHPFTPIARIEAIAESAQADVVITGHTHWPFVRRVSGTLFVNAGSVGRPGDGDVRAAYALITLAPDTLPEASIHRIPYPVEQVVEALAPAGLPVEFAELYRTGQAAL